jgi:hypothetical protein
VTPPASWRAIYERLFEKGPDSFSRPERETIRDAIEEAWNAGAAASPSREAPGDTPDFREEVARIWAGAVSIDGEAPEEERRCIEGALRRAYEMGRALASPSSPTPDLAGIERALRPSRGRGLDEDETTCGECGDDYALRPGEDPTPECDRCAHVVLARARAAVARLSRPEAPATMLSPSLLIAWLELLAEQTPPSSAIDWQMVGRDALRIVRWALASPPPPTPEAP